MKTFCASQSESPIRKRPRTMASSQKHGCSLNMDNEGASCSGPIYNVQPPLARMECPGAPLSPGDSDVEQQEFPFQPPQLHSQVKLHQYDVSTVSVLGDDLVWIILILTVILNDRIKFQFLMFMGSLVSTI